MAMEEEVPLAPTGGRPRREDGDDEPNLRGVFLRISLVMSRASTLPRFALLVGPSDLLRMTLSLMIVGEWILMQHVF